MSFYMHLIAGFCAAVSSDAARGVFKNGRWQGWIIVAVFALSSFGTVSVRANELAFLDVDSEGSSSGEAEMIRKSFDFASSFAAYGLEYNIDIPADAPEETCTSRLWAFRGGNLTLGMVSPSSANWYRQSFLRVRVDGISLHDIPGTFRVIRETGPDALLEGTWNTAKGPVHVRVAMRGGDDKLLVRVALPPDTEAEKIQLRLTAYPQDFSEPRSRA
ncbi:MAG: hypothetical protein ACODAD_09125, partial [Planctomycetota bacterium]